MIIEITGLLLGHDEHFWDNFNEPVSQLEKEESPDYLEAFRSYITSKQGLSPEKEDLSIAEA
eukprot:10329906-Prorocentrum_lima.AAC.1